MFSIISIYNKPEVLKKRLLSSLQQQSVKYELIAIDNTQKQFISVTSALNYGITQVKENNKYIMFVHPDIELPNNDWLLNAETYLDKLPDLGIAGVAGMTANGGRGEVREGDDLHLWHLAKTISKPEVVQTVDECLIIIPKQVLKKLQFDEQVCNYWHLYAVDYSLSVKKLNLQTYVLPLSVNHYSAGFADKYYYQGIKKLLKKHKKNYSEIYTTCGNFKTRLPLYLQKPGLILKLFE